MITRDYSPNAYDYTPNAYDYTPNAYDYTPNAYDYTPNAYDYTPNAYDYTPNAYDYTRMHMINRNPIKKHGKYGNPIENIKKIMKTILACNCV